MPIRRKAFQLKRHANIMKRSNQLQMRVWNLPGLIFQCIALIALVGAFMLFWNSSKGVPSVESGLTFDATTPHSFSVLQENLYRMLPVLFGSILFSVVIAFYLEEWLAKTCWSYRIITNQIVILAGIPSLIYGLMGIYFFAIRTQKVSILVHALTLVLLVVPNTIQSTQEAIQNVDRSLRDAAYALGANRWRVIVDHVFPDALPTIVAGICTAISRALAIAALIIVVYIWRIPMPQSGDIFYIPGGVIILLSLALLTSVLSSLLKRKTNLV